MSGLTFLFAVGAAFALNATNALTQTPLFQEESPGVMIDITSRCTLNGVAPTCSASGFPSENGEYWTNAAKSGTPFQSASVFRQPTL